MNTILIDTNFYAGVIFGRKEAVDIVRRSQSILMCPIVVGELLFGFKNGRREKENILRLENFTHLKSVRIVPMTEKTSEYFALITWQLKKDGTPIPTNDIWIAACAMEHAAGLATFDKHFHAIKNLILEV